MLQIANHLRRRTNMVEDPSESWRPPLFARPSPGGFAKLLAAARRFVDIQAGSTWMDVAAVLPSVRGSVLDVGCGAQPFRSLVHPDATYLGIDTEGAKAHFGYEMPDTTYFTGDRWPVADGSIDFVLCTETMEHVFDTRGLLSEVSRSLNPGGAVLLTIPFAARWHFIPYDYWRFTPSCLDRLLRGSGFTDVRVYARGNALTVACYKVMALILPLLAAQRAKAPLSWFIRVVGVALAPVLCILAVLANISLLGRGGNDCLGYTVVAHKANPASFESHLERVHES
jgi:SAM-dependent methyltransferase